MQLNASRLKFLQAQDDIVNSMKESASNELVRVASDKKAYKMLLKALIVQVIHHITTKYQPNSYVIYLQTHFLDCVLSFCSVLFWFRLDFVTTQGASSVAEMQRGRSKACGIGNGGSKERVRRESQSSSP